MISPGQLFLAGSPGRLVLHKGDRFFKHEEGSGGEILLSDYISEKIKDADNDGKAA